MRCAKPSRRCDPTVFPRLAGRFPRPSGPGRGFTLLELLIVLAILALAIAVAVVHFRHRQPGVGRLAANLAFHMKIRQATDLLTENLMGATEVLKPAQGYSLDYLVVANLANRPQVFFLEKASKKEEGPNLLVMGEGGFSGTSGGGRKVLCTNVQQVFFTPISPGLVTVVITFLDPGGKELSSILQIPLKNVSSGSG